LVCPDREQRSIIRANPAAVRIPVAAGAVDANAATPASAATVASAAADNHATAPEAAAAETTTTAETAAASETTAAAAATATSAAAAAATGISRGTRSGQHQCRSADDAEAIHADQGKRCQPACEKIAGRILSHFDLRSVKLFDLMVSSVVELPRPVSDACENQIAL
jgi:hypothetical protein